MNSIHGPIQPTDPLTQSHESSSSESEIDIPFPPNAPKITGDPKNNGAAGVNRTLANPPKSGSLIPEDKEPIQFIIDKIQEETKLKLQDCKDLKITSSFTSEPGGLVKAMSYRDPPLNPKAAQCYYFEREWTIQVTDQAGVQKTFTLKRNIYTNITIPEGHDAALLRDKETIAGTVAGMYGNFVENAVLFKAGKETSYDKGALTHDQITKVQRDGFLTMALYYNDKQVKPNSMRKATNLTLTHVDLRFRAGKSDAEDEKLHDSNFLVNLSRKVNNNVSTIGQQQRQVKYAYVTDDNSDQKFKELAAIQRFRMFEEEDLAGKSADVLADELKAAQIDEKALKSHYQTENEALTERFGDRWHLFNESGRVDELRNKYGKGQRKVFSSLKAELPAAHAKATGLKKITSIFKSKPPKNEDFDVLRKVMEIEETTTNEALKNEATEVINAFRAALDELKAINAQLQKNEDLIIKLGATKDEKARIDIEQVTRDEVIADIEDILAEGSGFGDAVSSEEELSLKGPTPDEGLDAYTFDEFSDAEADDDDFLDLFDDSVEGKGKERLIEKEERKEKEKEKEKESFDPYDWA